MAGGWRISEAEELRALRAARRDARVLRTEAAWNRFADQVARCEHLGLLGDDVVIPTPGTPDDAALAEPGAPPARRAAAD